MNKKIIVVEGYLASGKSTFAKQLSKVTNVPYLMKDTFKIALCQNFSVTNRDDSSRFSAVTFDAMMYVMERLLETDYPLIIEGNFVPYGVKKIDEANIIKTLIDKYDYKSLTYKFVGKTQVLHQRFIEREKTPERGQVNTVGFVPSYSEFDTWCHNLDEFTVGGKIARVDTTDFNKVNYSNLLEMASTFINFN